MSAVIPTFLPTLKEHLLQGVLLTMPLQTLEGNHYFGLNIRFDYHLINAHYMCSRIANPEFQPIRASFINFFVYLFHFFVKSVKLKFGIGNS